MLTLNHISYIHPNGLVLLNDINLSVNAGERIALIGKNGTGKSTLLRILAGRLSPSAGNVVSKSKPYYLPQHTGQFDRLTVAETLCVDKRLNALKEIISGNVTEEQLSLLGDDWLLEERCSQAFAKWNIDGLGMNHKMEMLSGGQKTKVFLAGIEIHQPGIVLLDEPSNHLDASSRKMLYDYIQSTSDTLIVVSHDKVLLNLLNVTLELNKGSITTYGGNYGFYSEQKKNESDALIQNLKSKEKELRKAKEVERESLERKQKLDARGKKKQEKAGLPTISMNTFRNNAEKSTSRIKDVHAEKTETLSIELRQLRTVLPEEVKMKLDLNNTALHKGKRLIEAIAINFKYAAHWLWSSPLDVQIASGDRIVIKGTNSSGKTTLVKLILGELTPQSGFIQRSGFSALYIDQEYSMIDNNITLYQQAQRFNTNRLQEHEVKIRLNRFLFHKEDWDKVGNALSGGEKMRLMLCCLMIKNQSPDVIILDEPTNNLDIQSTEILTAVIEKYEGTLIIISHDSHFLKHMNVTKEINLS